MFWLRQVFMILSFLIYGQTVLLFRSLLRTGHSIDQHIFGVIAEESQSL